MTFWDDLGKKASVAADKVAQQAKVLSEIAKLNSAVSGEEKKMNANYSAIGKLYVSLHKDDCEEAFESMIAAIAESETKIAECKAKIRAVKGVCICEKCQAEMPLGNAFCSACGAPMPKVEEVVVEAEEVVDTFEDFVDTTAEVVEEIFVTEEQAEETEE